MKALVDWGKLRLSLFLECPYFSALRLVVLSKFSYVKNCILIRSDKFFSNYFQYYYVHTF